MGNRKWSTNYYKRREEKNQELVEAFIWVFVITVCLLLVGYVVKIFIGG